MGSPFDKPSLSFYTSLIDVCWYVHSKHWYILISWPHNVIFYLLKPFDWLMKLTFFWHIHWLKLTDFDWVITLTTISECFRIFLLFYFLKIKSLIIYNNKKKEEKDTKSKRLAKTTNHTLKVKGLICNFWHSRNYNMSNTKICEIKKYKSPIQLFLEVCVKLYKIICMQQI